MEEIMTDYQYKSIITMLLELLDSCTTVDEAKQKLIAILEADYKKGKNKS